MFCLVHEPGTVMDRQPLASVGACECCQPSGAAVGVETSLNRHSPSNEMFSLPVIARSGAAIGKRPRLVVDGEKNSETRFMDSSPWKPPMLGLFEKR